MPFDDRHEAGRRLAMALERVRGRDPLVLGLPRAGLPVAAEVADALRAPLDVVLVRTLGVPWHPELAMGAIGESHIRLLNDDVLRAARVSAHAFEDVVTGEERELARRAASYRRVRQRIPIAGRTVVIVDDRIATGATMRAACQVVRVEGACRVIAAAPVATLEAVRTVHRVADEVVCLETLPHFGAVGDWYTDFSTPTEDAVLELLAHAEMAGPVRSASP